MQALIKNRPGEAFRLCQYMHRRLGVAFVLVPEARAQCVDLDAALHHQRPGDQHAVRGGKPAMSLIGAQVGELGAQRLAPAQGIALVTGVTGILRLANLR